MKISMFGTGYVGLVTGACIAEMGNDVLCVDVDEGRVAALNRGEMPIFEDQLSEMVERNVSAGRLAFSCDAAAAVAHGDLLFVAVGTPSGADGSADLKYVLQVARTIGQHMRSPKIIVNKSTVPVGTGDRVRETVSAELAKRAESIEFSVVSNPEFLKEGAAIADFMKPDRIIIGSDDHHGADMLERLYQPFNRNHDKVLHMDLRSAELAKYAANVMLAARISLMNEFANLSERLGADIESVRLGIGADPRIGYQFIYPGAGYGGSCFPKDVRALAYLATDCGYEANLIPAIEATNNAQKNRLFEKLEDYFESLRGKTIALWGLAFKPNTDDMREAPSRELITALGIAGARVQAYDPIAGREAREMFADVPYVTICESRQATLDNADALVVITEWNEFRSPDFSEIKAKLRHPVVFDGRNLYDPKQLRALGLDYEGIGRTGRHDEKARKLPLASARLVSGAAPAIEPELTAGAKPPGS